MGTHPRRVLLLLALGLAAAPALAAPGGRAAVLDPLEALYPDLEKLYLDLHRTPELSWQEEKTSAKLAARLRALGYQVAEQVGGFGLVGVLRNGSGPTVLLRTDMDALPLEEKTGLPYASRATGLDDGGHPVPVMHACGHDIHMTSWVGAATLLARARQAWKGTLVLVGQPAEERGGGAAGMLKAGLYTRFPRPDFALALHDAADLPAGTVGWVPGFALANVDSVDLTFFGRGGHGAYPHKTVDPIVMASRFVAALQTLVSRENSPFDPAVVTVGSFHAGLKHNVIPDEAHLQLTVRSYKDEVRARLLAGIERIAKGEAASAGAPRPPEVRTSEATPATYNDPTVARRLAAALAGQLGEAKVLERSPVMGGEDFSEFGRAGVPAVLLWLGAVEPGQFAEAQRTGQPLPSLHSSRFAPDRGPTIRTGVTVLTVSALELLGVP
jgi:hippurate hydrolase